MRARIYLPFRSPLPPQRPREHPRHALLRCSLLFTPITLGAVACGTEIQLRPRRTHIARRARRPPPLGDRRRSHQFVAPTARPPTSNPRPASGHLGAQTDVSEIRTSHRPRPLFLRSSQPPRIVRGLGGVPRCRGTPALHARDASAATPTIPQPAQRRATGRSRSSTRPAGFTTCAGYADTACSTPGGSEGGAGANSRSASGIPAGTPTPRSTRRPAGTSTPRSTAARRTLLNQGPPHAGWLDAYGRHLGASTSTSPACPRGIRIRASIAPTARCCRVQLRRQHDQAGGGCPRAMNSPRPPRRSTPPTRLRRIGPRAVRLSTEPTRAPARRARW